METSKNRYRIDMLYVFASVLFYVGVDYRRDT